MKWENSYCEKVGLRKALTAYRRPIKISGCPLCGSLPKVFAEIDSVHGEERAFVQCPSCGLTSAIRQRRGMVDVAPFSGDERSPIKTALDEWEKNGEWRESYSVLSDGYFRRMSDGVRIDEDGNTDMNTYSKKLY